MAKLLILVHGLGGTADGTWGDFPEFLMKDPDVDYEIVSYGYQSPHIVKQFLQRAPSILNIANGLLTDLRTRCDLDNDEIILAGHSLGGLIVKKLLLKLKDQKINHKIRKICFFDVPHDGSGYANVAKYISFRNRHLRSLCRDSSELDDLNDQWVDSELDNIFEITSILASNDDIVSSSSAKSIFRYHKVETINDVDHVTIVKPLSMQSSSYLVFKKFLLEKKTLQKYRNAASRDLADWKKIERNHSYHYASDEKRLKNLNAIKDALKLDSAVVRLTGASGLGKTRLILEAMDDTESVDSACVLIFDAPEYENKIKESIRKMVDDGVDGLVIVENCNTELHNQLTREVNKTECLLKIITIGYTDDQVDESILVHLSPLSDDAIKIILSPILLGMETYDVDRVARFAQGYPLMATLIAQQYQKEGHLLGSIESSSVVRKLIDGDGVVTGQDKEMLSACSLFDVFGTTEGIAREEAKYIAENVAGSDLRVFDRVLSTFTRRQIINRAGRYARIVPKPLALTLASEWWRDTSYERQKQLIETLPDSLIQSFCTQAAYLDDQPNVQRFSDKLFGGRDPFVKAEELFTEKGSKLFRTFVEVNPESTSNALYSILSNYSHEELLFIDGNIRRNLVWGLEKLCFHEHVFEKSSWCMLLLASAENESWSNNAIGMFSQLFRVNLSGTQAKPNIRFDVLDRAIKINQLHIDKIVLEALKQAINTHGGTRTIGAEYQGTKAPLEEWQPEVWQEVYDFWQKAFDLMLVLFMRGEVQKEIVLSNLGHSIRGFMANGRIEMLDVAIKKIVAVNGRYWPAALESIKIIFQYDSEKMDQNSINALNSWLDLLSPDAAILSEKLKILVTNPPREYRNGDDGHYVDVAARNAQDLATKLSPDISEIFPYLDSLLVGEQKQSYAFGYQLAHDVADIKPLLDLSLEHLIAIEKPNPRLILGLYRGIFSRSTMLWQEYINLLLKNAKLVRYYPDFICTGNITKEHLDKLLELIESSELCANSATILCYGGVIENIEPNTMADFCMQLAKIESWPAFNIIYMYSFTNKDCINNLRAQLKQLVTCVPLHRDQQGTSTDLYQWYDIACKLLDVRDQEFAIAITHQLISACKFGLNNGDIWSYTKPLMLILMKDYGEILWPIFGDAIVRSEGLEKYWLQQLLDRETGLAANMPSVLTVIPVESIINWCLKYEEIGPVFVARCLNVFDVDNESHQPSQLFISLLENFGNDERVEIELNANISSRSWSGSLIPYLESDKLGLTPLLEHTNSNVRRWVKGHISYIDRQIAEESQRDDECGFGYY